MTHQRAMLPGVQPFHIGAQVWTLRQQTLLFSKIQRIAHNDVGHAKRAPLPGNPLRSAPHLAPQRYA